MADTKFTPGPWAVRYDYVVQAPSFDDGRLVPVAQPYGVNSDGTDLFANARLIAAAPELYEALDQLLTDMLIAQGNMRDAAKHDPRWEGCAEAIQPRVDAARAALAKARGEKP